MIYYHNHNTHQQCEFIFIGTQNHPFLDRPDVYTEGFYLRFCAFEHNIMQVF